jgi:threonine dehydrogenase-like Zn-dependent dehydrogenase
MSDFTAVFADGPASGAALTLARVPRLLRVVIDAAGEVDALDQPEDRPHPDERVCVYAIRQMTRCIVCCRQRRNGHRCSRSTIVQYQHHPGPTPGNHVLRDTAAWAEWMKQQEDR